MNWKPFLKGKKTAAELAAQIDDSDGQLRAARERHGEIRGQRERVILEGSDSEKAALRKEMADLDDRVEELELGVAALRGRHGELVREEELDGVSTLLDQAEQARKRAVARVRSEYGPAVEAILRVLVDMRLAEESIAAANAAAANANFERRIDSVFSGVPSSSGYTGDFTGKIVLVAAEDQNRLAWPVNSHSESAAHVEEIRAKLAGAAN